MMPLAKIGRRTAFHWQQEPFSGHHHSKLIVIRARCSCTTCAPACASSIRKPTPKASGRVTLKKRRHLNVRAVSFAAEHSCIV